jgi:hypothetical protein
VELGVSIRKGIQNMKCFSEFIDLVSRSTHFPIFTFSTSGYAEILIDIPINELLYGITDDESGNALNISESQKKTYEFDVTAIQNAVD